MQKKGRTFIPSVSYEELYRQGIKKTLRQTFTALNRAFYNGRLPRPSFCIGTLKESADAYAGTYYNGFLKQFELTFTPLFLEHLQEQGAKRLYETMLHEMSHIACVCQKVNRLSLTGYGLDGVEAHGQDFKDMCERHGLRAEWCNDAEQWAHTELKDPEHPVFGEIGRIYEQNVLSLKKG